MNQEHRQNILLVSHGETVAQHNGVFSDLDTPMTDVGRDQVKAAADEIRDEGREFEIIYCSPLPRAQETAKIFSAILNIPIETIPELKQQDFGIYTGQKKDEKAYREYLQDFIAGNRRCGSLADFLRCSEVVSKKIIKDGKDALVVAHRFTWVGFEVFFNQKPYRDSLLTQEEKSEFYR